MIFLLPTTYITLIPTPYDLKYPIKIDSYFTLKYVVSCLCVIDIYLGFMIPVDKYILINKYILNNNIHYFNIITIKFKFKFNITIKTYIQ